MPTTRLSRTSGEYAARIETGFRLARVAMRIAGADDPDEHTAIVEKTPGKGYCVKSEKNPDWSGGCYPTKDEAEGRLDEVEMFKHMKKKKGARLLTEEDLRAFADKLV